MYINMLTTKSRTLTALLASVALLLPLTAPANASQLSIQPLLIALSRSSASSSLRLENNGTEDVRLQIKGFAWSETAKDDVALQPTEDLIVFPSVMTLKPGEHRSVRIAAVVPVEATEKSYRIQIVELAAPPVLGAPIETMTIHLHSRITVPVFLPSLARDQQHDALAGVAAHAKAVTVAVTNPGNTHSLVHEVRISAKDASGAVLFTGSVPGWYLLPGITRTYSIAAPPGLCARVQSIGIDIATDGPPIHTSSPALPECAS
jgi:fimbrial chaperone protein